MSLSIECYIHFDYTHGRHRVDVIYEVFWLLLSDPVSNSAQFPCETKKTTTTGNCLKLPVGFNCGM